MDNRDEMPRWVRRLIYQLVFVVVVIGCIVMVKYEMDSSAADAKADIQCKVYDRC